MLTHCCMCIKCRLCVSLNKWNVIYGDNKYACLGVIRWRDFNLSKLMELRSWSQNHVRFLKKLTLRRISIDLTFWYFAPATLSGSSQTCLEPASAPYQYTASVLASALALLPAFLPLGSPDPSMTTYQTIALHHKDFMLYEILRNMDGFYVSSCLFGQEKKNLSDCWFHQK